MLAILFSLSVGGFLLVLKEYTAPASALAIVELTNEDRASYPGSALEELLYLLDFSPPWKASHLQSHLLVGGD